MNSFDVIGRVFGVIIGTIFMFAGIQGEYIASGPLTSGDSLAVAGVFLVFLSLSLPTSKNTSL